MPSAQSFRAALSAWPRVEYLPQGIALRLASTTTRKAHRVGDRHACSSLTSATMRSHRNDRRRFLIWALMCGYLGRLLRQAGFEGRVCITDSAKNGF